MEYSAVEYDEGINDIQSSIRYKEWQDRLDIANKFTQGLGKVWLGEQFETMKQCWASGTQNPGTTCVPT
jgi:hypothetical protein